MVYPDNNKKKIYKSGISLVEILNLVNVPFKGN